MHPQTKEYFEGKFGTLTSMLQKLIDENKGRKSAGKSFRKKRQPGWVTAEEFAKRYKFISKWYLNYLANKYSAIFEGHVEGKGKKFYAPHRIVEVFEKELLNEKTPPIVSRNYREEKRKGNVHIKIQLDVLKNKGLL